MRHGRRKKKLGVTTRHRMALLRNLLRSLVIYKRIRTTVVKAKATSAFADRMVQIAKRGDLHARRTLISHLGCPETADQLIKKIAPHFKERNGGYTRVLKLSEYRPGDAGDVAILEFTAQIAAPAKPKKKEKAVKVKEVSETSKKEKEEPKKKSSAKEEKLEAKKESVEKKASKKEEVSKEDAKKESEKKGGFLGALRKFLKGDEQ